MGLEMKPMSRDMTNAANAGIQMVESLSLAALAVVITGAMINATTAGLIPMKMLESAWLFLMVSGVRKIAMARIIRKEGSMVPSDATIPPLSPLSLSPIEVAMFTARMPGRDYAMARRSRNSSRSIQ